MFKVNALNGDYLDTTSSVSQVLGKALHKSMQAYFGGIPDMPTPANEAEAIKFAHDMGIVKLDDFSEGFIEYSETIKNRQNMGERYAFSFFKMISILDQKNEIKDVIMVEKPIEHKIEIEGHVLPIALKSVADLVYRDSKKRLKIRDWKFTQKFSDPESIDGAKLLQAAFNYFTVYAELGEAPYSMIFHEFKVVENREKQKPQYKEFEIVFTEHPLLFDFFFRMYEDITDAIMGKQVYLPNIQTNFDREVSILAYIHRLDIDEERAKAFKEAQVENITDFLKKKIQKDGAMKKYLEIVSTKFISAKNLNYKAMKVEERIKMKLAEHGIGLEFDSKVEGRSVTLYRFEAALGVKMTRIESFKNDIEQVVERSGIRVLAPIPNSGLIGFEIPNEHRTFPVGIPPSHGFDLAIGETIMGKVRRFDIRTAPHMIIAGSAGSGKSVWLNSIIRQLLKTPHVELHLFDPKQVELFHFEGEKKVIEYQSTADAISSSLSELVNEMEMRYDALKEAKVKNIDQMPGMKPKIIIIDEFADLAMRGEVGKQIQMIAQKGRAAGMHLIIATQRASTKVISGDTKVNFPIKIVFKMAKAIDSRVMIDEEGAEKLLGKGDMLFVGDAGTERLQGYSE